MTLRQPKISVITPSYNQARYLEKTITSVLSQGYESLEYIVLDGGSSDKSVDIIKAYSKDLAHWESGPDDGQAAALQHGMKVLATGDIVSWLNSDDMLMPGALAEVERQYHLSDWTLLAGRTAIIDEHDRPIHLQVPQDRSIESMLTFRAYYQALAHYTMFHSLFDTGAVVSPDMAAVDADVKTLQASLNNMVAFGAAAKAAGDHCFTPGLRKAISDFKKPDAATIKKVLVAVAKPDLGITYLVDGAKQQVLAISALAEAAKLQPVSDAVAPLIPKRAQDAPEAKDLTKALPDIRAKIGA